MQIWQGALKGATGLKLVLNLRPMRLDFQLLSTIVLNQVGYTHMGPGITSCRA